MKVGVVMPIGPQDGTGVVPPWEATRVAALATEEAGFDSAWVYDHLLFRFGTDPTLGIHECWTVLSAMAAITSRVELGILVLAMPFRNPGLLAKMAATFEDSVGWPADPGRGLRLERTGVHRLRLPVRPPGRPVRGGTVGVGAGAARGARLLLRSVALGVRPRDPAALLAAGWPDHAAADCRPRAADAGRWSRATPMPGTPPGSVRRRSCRRGWRDSRPPWPRPDAIPPRSRSRSASTWCCRSTRTRSIRRWRSRRDFDHRVAGGAGRRSCEPTRRWASATSRWPWNRPRRRPSRISARQLSCSAGRRGAHGCCSGN